MNKQIELVVKQAVIDALSLDIPPEDIKNEDSCMEPPLYFDSLAILRTFTNIEDMLNIQFDEEDLIDAPPFSTIFDLICYIEETLQKTKKEG